MTRFGDYLVPKVLRYNGSWGVVTEEAENAVFTATLFDGALQNKKTADRLNPSAPKGLLKCPF